LRAHLRAKQRTGGGTEPSVETASDGKRGEGGPGRTLARAGTAQDHADARSPLILL
jgi:hypothetical protein